MSKKKLEDNIRACQDNVCV